MVEREYRISIVVRAIIGIHRNLILKLAFC